MLIILTVKHRYMQDLIRVHSYRAYNHPFAIPCYSSTGDSEFLEKRQTKLHMFIYLFFFNANDVHNPLVSAFFAS